MIHILKNKHTGEELGRFDSCRDAGIWLSGYMQDCNKGLNALDEYYLYPTDFIVEEVLDLEECPINNYDDAVAFLCESGRINDHEEAITALRQLFTICDAWNKADGFVPDFSDDSQRKYFPFFMYDIEKQAFVFSNTSWSYIDTLIGYGTRVCFASERRAEQFGREFETLYNTVLKTN